MELQLYLEIFKRRVVVVIIVAALAVAVEFAASLLMTPIYRTRATVRVTQDVGILELGIRESYGERLMNTYSRILTSWPVLEQAVERLGNSPSATQLRSKIEIEVVPETELMRIIVTDTDPALARNLANTLVDLLIEHVQSTYGASVRSSLQILDEQLISIENELEQDRELLSTLLITDTSSAAVKALRNKIGFQEVSYIQLLDRYKLAQLNASLRANSVTVVASALLPRSPFNSLGMREIVIALVIGLFGGVGLALVLENLDTRIHGPRQLEYLTRLPVLGVVPRGSLPLGGLEHKFGTGNKVSLTEAYRLLGINLQALGRDTSLKTILITSAVPKEGKSTVTINLAQTLAERGRTVYLVESDLRRPTIAKTLRIEDVSPGLAGLLAQDSLLSQESLKWYMQPTKQPTLLVITGGAPSVSPTELLASPLMEELLSYLADQGRIILLDAPPVLGVADASVLAPMVDGVVLVARQAQTKREQVLAALKQLQASRANVLGFVFIQKSGKGWGY